MYQNNPNNLQEGDESQKGAVEQALEQSFVKLKQAYQSLSSQISPTRFIQTLAIVIALLWLSSGFYIVDEGNRGVETRFGAYTQMTTSGLNWHIPYPIEDVTLVNVAKQQFIEIGYRKGFSRNPSVLSEALMLTRDENIVDVSLAIQYQIKDAHNYLFNVDNPIITLKHAAQSAERAIIGKNTMDFVLTEGRSEVVLEIQKLTQQILDDYQTGISITSVNLQDAQPPEQVQAAFEDAIKAREDKQRLINEAQAYANEVIPKARGQAARKLEEAEAYKQQVIATATGDISRFNQLYEQYKKAPEVTRKRLLIESMESVLSRSDVVMLDNSQNGNSVFYLPLEKMKSDSKNSQTQQSNTPKNDYSSTNKNYSVKAYRPTRGRD